ncbi:MAG: hypothetical protein ACERKD_05630 [Prolixibacteraceae bacterium]
MRTIRARRAQTIVAPGGVQRNPGLRVGKPEIGRSGIVRKTTYHPSTERGKFPNSDREERAGCHHYWVQCENNTSPEGSNNSSPGWSAAEPGFKSRKNTIWSIIHF